MAYVWVSSVGGTPCACGLFHGPAILRIRHSPTNHPFAPPLLSSFNMQHPY